MVKAPVSSEQNCHASPGVKHYRFERYSSLGRANDNGCKRLSLCRFQEPLENPVIVGSLEIGETT